MPVLQVKVHEAEMAEAVTKAQEKQKHELEQHFNEQLSAAMVGRSLVLWFGFWR